MALITVDTPRASERHAIRAKLRDLHASIDSTIRDCMKHAASEGSRARLFGCNQSARMTARDTDRRAESAQSMPGVVPPKVQVAPLSDNTSTGAGKIIRRALTAALMLLALAGTVALQAAIHVYVLRLTG